MLLPQRCSLRAWAAGGGCGRLRRLRCCGHSYDRVRWRVCACPLTSWLLRRCPLRPWKACE